jgi:hypothetical protein
LRRITLRKNLKVKAVSCIINLFKLTKTNKLIHTFELTDKKIINQRFIYESRLSDAIQEFKEIRQNLSNKSVINESGIYLKDIAADLKNDIEQISSDMELINNISENTDLLLL